MLVGCAGNPGSEETPQPEENPSQNDAEQTTGGEVEVFALDDTPWNAAYLLGENLLLVLEGEKTLLQLADGETGELSLKAELNADLRNGWLRTKGESISYFDPATGDVVFLNNMLREVSRLHLPEGFTGCPQLSLDWQAVYFCTAMGIYKMDLQTGLSHLLREQKNPWQSVAGVLFGGKVLRCDAGLSEENREVRLVDATTGESLWVGNHLETLLTGEEMWYYPSRRSFITEYFIGNGEEIQCFWPLDDTEQILPVMDIKMALTVAKAAAGCRLDAYDLETGLHTASVELKGYQRVISVVGESEQSLWFLAESQEESSVALCHWNPGKNTVADADAYYKPYFTAENVDTQGLEALQQSFTEMGQTYGVDILIGDSAVNNPPEGNGLTKEFVTQAYEKAMPLLEKALMQFPEGFFKTLASKTGSKSLKICLVREISDIPEEIGCLQYWKGKEAYLVLALGDDLEQRFYHGISYAIETRVLSVCTAYYDWDKLNPEGFEYGADLKEENYLTGEDKAFIHGLAMTSAREDRAFIMEYACMPENAECFQGAAMQAKLKMLCDGIREAFDLEKTKIIYPWEQHLKSE